MCEKRMPNRKNAMYIYQQVIDMQNANPGLVYVSILACLQMLMSLRSCKKMGMKFRPYMLRMIMKNRNCHLVMSMRMRTILMMQ